MKNECEIKSLVLCLEKEAETEAVYLFYCTLLCDFVVFPFAVAVVADSFWNLIYDLAWLTYHLWLTEIQFSHHFGIKNALSSNYYDPILNKTNAFAISHSYSHYINVVMDFELVQLWLWQNCKLCNQPVLSSDGRMHIQHWKLIPEL